MKKLIKLNESILEWAESKDLLKYENSKKQGMKMLSEAGEICDAICNEDRDDLIDAIGDTYITIVIFCEQLSISMTGDILTDCSVNAVNPYADTYQKSINISLSLGVLCDELFHRGTCYINKLVEAIESLSVLANLNNTTLENCVETAYDVIKDRTGRTVNGTFIKN